MLRQAPTHPGLNHGKFEFDPTKRRHVLDMIRHRLAARHADERGFTLIELLVVTILIGILAAIALAVFLNQKDKGNDASAKSNVTNLSHIVQACNASNEQRDDFRDCDTKAKLSTTLPYDQSAALNEVASGDCTDPPGTVAKGEVAVTQAGPACFTIVGTSASGNRFWLIRHPDGSISHDCETHNVDGCPTDGEWAG